MASDSIKLYTAIYVALVLLAASKFIYFHVEFFSYWQAFGATMVSATLKTLLIAGYYQHLRWEKSSLSWLMALSLGLAMLLMAAASYSIT